MALKRKITKLEFDALNDVLKAEYKAHGEAYVLDTVGDEGFDALKLEKQQALDKANKYKADLDALQTKFDDMLRGAIPKADVEALENSWKTKLATREQELNAQIETSQRAINNLSVDAAAQKLASEISTTPELLMPLIRQRLKAEQVDGKVTTRVLDTVGQPSALTLEDLAKEFKSNAAYAPIIIGSKASGGGAGGQGNGGGATKKLTEMSEAERVDLYKRDPAAFDQLVKQSKT